MGFEDFIEMYGPGDECIVCGKQVAGGRGFSHLKHGDDMVTLCCPLCFETFQKSPQEYVSRRKAREISQSILKGSTGKKKP